VERESGVRLSEGDRGLERKSSEGGRKSEDFGGGMLGERNCTEKEGRLD